MRMVTEIGMQAIVCSALAVSGPAAAHAAGLDETVGQLLHRDAQEAIAGSAPVLPLAPPRLLPDVLTAPLLPPPPPAAAPMVTAIYGKPGDLSVVLQMDSQRLVLDQRSGKVVGGAQPVRLVEVSGPCARIVLAPRQAPTSLCVASSFGLAHHGGARP